MSLFCSIRRLDRRSHHSNPFVPSHTGNICPPSTPSITIVASAWIHSRWMDGMYRVHCYSAPIRSARPDRGGGSEPRTAARVRIDRLHASNNSADQFTCPLCRTINSKIPHRINTGITNALVRADRKRGRLTDDLIKRKISNPEGTNFFLLTPSHPNTHICIYIYVCSLRSSRSAVFLP